MEPARKELFPFCHSNQYGLLSSLFHPLQVCFYSGKVFEDFNLWSTVMFVMQREGTVSPVCEQRL